MSRGIVGLADCLGVPSCDAFGVPSLVLILIDEVLPIIGGRLNSAVLGVGADGAGMAESGTLGLIL